MIAAFYFKSFSVTFVMTTPSFCGVDDTLHGDVGGAEANSAANDFPIEGKVFAKY
jgi:hypothetical protein